MPQFYYQIKGMTDAGRWDWPPIHSDCIEAINSKDARKKLEEEFGMKLPGGRLKKDADNQRILLTLIDMDDKPYLRERFIKRNCKQCGAEYTLNQKYLVKAGGQSDFCSDSCTTDFKNAEGIEFNVNFDFNGIHEPVIYKITNKTTGMCYIGKTTQAFTLRWYQHFYQSSGTKFHAAVKQYGVADWTFEVIEVLQCSKLELKERILERESYWMKYYDSIENGYNSVISKRDEEEVEPDDELQMKLFQD